jgi:hypothetical protein
MDRMDAAVQTLSPTPRPNVLTTMSGRFELNSNKSLPSSVKVWDATGLAG